MRAVIINECGGSDKLQHVTDFPLPKRKPGQVLVKTVSAGVNPVDSLVRSGRYKPESFPKVIGGDVAGYVDEADEGSKFKKGDAVAALTPGYKGTLEGCYAEYVAADEAWLARVPTASIPLDQAAGLPLVGLTAWQALQGANPQAGQTVLIQAASGGVGHVAVQIAKSLGLVVTAVCGPKNVEFVKGLGADQVIDYSQGDWQADLEAKGTKFDIVLDTRGTRGGDLKRALQLLSPSGHLSHVRQSLGTDEGLLGQLKADHEAGKGPSVSVTLVAPNGQQLQHLFDLVDQGKLKLTVSTSLPLERAREAHDQVDSGHTRGKIVLTL